MEAPCNSLSLCPLYYQTVQWCRQPLAEDSIFPSAIHLAEQCVCMLHFWVFGGSHYISWWHLSGCHISVSHKPVCRDIKGQQEAPLALLHALCAGVVCKTQQLCARRKSYVQGAKVTVRKKKPLDLKWRKMIETGKHLLKGWGKKGRNKKQN